jgi:catechol 2,3-dioxygenase-like lactoylglutathione lyase family enzyme
MSVPPALGLRHVALKFHDLSAAERFFVDVLGYRVEWRPDAENVYLIHRGDNVALHQAPAVQQPGQLDHIGILVARAADVDAWATHLDALSVTLTARPKTHRDGARSLYLQGPEGLIIQIIHHPPALEG